MSEAISYEDLTKIAVEHTRGNLLRGSTSYSELLALAWLYADSENRDLLFPAWSNYIAKHRLEALLK